MTSQLGVLSSLPGFKVLQLFIPIDVLMLHICQRFPGLLALFQALDETFKIFPASVDFAEGVVGMVANSEHETFEAWVWALFQDIDKNLGVRHLSLQNQG